MNAASPHDTGPQGLWKWVTPAIVLALTVYLVQITARLATDEAMLNLTAQTVKDRTPVFEQVIKMESRLSVIEAEQDRRKPIIDQIPVTNEQQIGQHLAIDDRAKRLEAIVMRLAQTVDRLEIRLDQLIELEREAHNRDNSTTDFRTLRPHYSTPQGETP